jgi:multicomponent Na+:H+ antiporter subunit G
MMTLFLASLIFIGSGFILVAAIGAIRFPDPLTRLVAVSKAVSFALVLMAAVAGVWFGTIDSVFKMTSLAVFVLLTSPVSAHLMARSARASQIPLSTRTQGIEYWHRSIQEGK